MALANSIGGSWNLGLSCGLPERERIEKCGAVDCLGMRIWAISDYRVKGFDFIALERLHFPGNVAIKWVRSWNNNPIKLV